MFWYIYYYLQSSHPRIILANFRLNDRLCDNLYFVVWCATIAIIWKMKLVLKWIKNIKAWNSPTEIVQLQIQQYKLGKKSENHGNYIGIENLFQIDQATFICRQWTN